MLNFEGSLSAKDIISQYTCTSKPEKGLFIL